MNRKSTLFCMAAAALAFLSACSTAPKGPTAEEEAAAREAARIAAEQAAREAAEKNRGIGRPGDVTDGALDNPYGKDGLSEPAHRIHFDFNSAQITEEAAEILNQNAKWIQARGFQEITVEGHCDERGTGEYNLAVGQKRADAAKQYLSSQGVDWYRIRAVSYGKERPLIRGHNEFSWSKNRRSELVVR